MVKSYYLKLQLLNFLSVQYLFKGGFPRKLIWRSLTPFKVSFLVWEISHGKIFTCDSLQKWRKILVKRCYMYKRGFGLGESLAT